MSQLIKFFNEISLSDIATVGGKNASLGVMIQQLAKQGIAVPEGFAVTILGYQLFVSENGIQELIDELSHFDYSKSSSIDEIKKCGVKIQDACINASIPDQLLQEIKNAIFLLWKDSFFLAVRSSATIEDIPGISCAGQQESFIGIDSFEQLLLAYKKCIASLFSDRALTYRFEKKIAPQSVGLSVCVQRVVRSDKAVSGIAFSLDTDSGLPGFVTIEASYGLGECIVKGSVNPDFFSVHKETFLKNFIGVVKKTKGQKKIMMLYDDHNKVKTIAVAKSKQSQWSIDDQLVKEISRQVLIIESYYSDYYKKWSPVDVEWAIDGFSKKLYIVQARPETVFSQKKNTLKNHYLSYSFAGVPPVPLVSGLAIGSKIVTGKAIVITDISQQNQVKEGSILVTKMTDPDWVVVMKRVAGIVTDQGGRTCHAAIVSRELGVCAVVGTCNATDLIKTGDVITLDCSTGHIGLIYQGALPFTTHSIKFDSGKNLPVKLMVNCAQPESAMSTAQLPVLGVGLARLEFIIAQYVKIHPMALIYPEKINDKKLKEQIFLQASEYQNLQNYFIEIVASNIALIAAAFYPRDVIVRFSDFKTNEYRSLLGGSFFEPKEENPMIGLRGAFRYCHPIYQDAFLLECAALLKVRINFGMTNAHCMIPFVRSVNEAQKVCKLLDQNGLSQIAGCKRFMMCELPGNVIILEKYASLFDGFSIGSNDLAQLALGIDRDSGVFGELNEHNEAAIAFLSLAIQKAKLAGKPISICGQAPSDFPEIGKLLIKEGIDAISLNADSVMNFISKIVQ